MSVNINKSFMIIFVLCPYLCQCGSRLVDTGTKKNYCPLWHIPGKNGACKCGATFKGVVTCKGKYLQVSDSFCLTWNNITEEVELHRTCLFTRFMIQDNTTKRCATLGGEYLVPANISGQELNRIICKNYNRQGRRCEFCIDGYGPAVFADGNICANCSTHRYLWIVYLFIQLVMITLIYFIFIHLQISMTSSPFNVIITYVQLGSLTVKLRTELQTRIVCRFGQTIMDIAITAADVFNLDFFHTVFPPMCVSPSMKAINALLFNYIIAIYPLLLTVLIYLCIQLHERNSKLIVLLSFPLMKCFKTIYKSWNPKRSIIKTWTTFFLLSFSKMFFISISLLLAFRVYNKKGELVSNSTFLLYDQTVIFFHKEHIPYAVLALLVVIVFNCLPTLFLLFYPTACFRKCLTCVGFRRWDIINTFVDIFQGHFKDGTNGTRDYRSLSALYLILKIVIGCQFVVAKISNHITRYDFPIMMTLGIIHVFIGSFMFATRPYSKAWMNGLDGMILNLVGVILILVSYGNVPSATLFLVATGFVLMIVVLTTLYIQVVYKCIKNCLDAHTKQ